MDDKERFVPPAHLVALGALFSGVGLAGLAYNLLVFRSGLHGANTFGFAAGGLLCFLLAAVSKHARDAEAGAVREKEPVDGE